jgi:hypothetical protein
MKNNQTPKNNSKPKTTGKSSGKTNGRNLSENTEREIKKAALQVADKERARERRGKEHVCECFILCEVIDEKRQTQCLKHYHQRPKGAPRELKGAERRIAERRTQLNPDQVVLCEDIDCLLRNPDAPHYHAQGTGHRTTPEIITPEEIAHEMHSNDDVCDALVDEPLCDSTKHNQLSFIRLPSPVKDTTLPKMNGKVPGAAQSGAKKVKVGSKDLPPVLNAGEGLSVEPQQAKRLIRTRAPRSAAFSDSEPEGKDNQFEKCVIFPDSEPDLDEKHVHEAIASWYRTYDFPEEDNLPIQRSGATLWQLARQYRKTRELYNPCELPPPEEEEKCDDLPPGCTADDESASASDGGEPESERNEPPDKPPVGLFYQPDANQLRWTPAPVEPEVPPEPTIEVTITGVVKKVEKGDSIEVMVVTRDRVVKRLIYASVDDSEHRRGLCKMFTKIIREWVHGKSKDCIDTASNHNLVVNKSTKFTSSTLMRMFGFPEPRTDDSRVYNPLERRYNVSFEAETFEDLFNTLTMSTGWRQIHDQGGNFSATIQAHIQTCIQNRNPGYYLEVNAQRTMNTVMAVINYYVATESRAKTAIPCGPRNTQLNSGAFIASSTGRGSALTLN